MRLLTAVFLISITTFCFSQEKIDSLMSELGNMKTKTKAYIDVVNNLWKRFQDLGNCG